MIISVNWLKKYTDIDVNVDELAELIGSRLVEVENVTNLGEKYKDVYVAKVVSCQRIEGSDHLSEVLIDDGSKREGVERNSEGLVQVVCGAPNVKDGMMVAWLPPEAIVPETFSKEPFKLSTKPLRGVMSNGMLASAKELDLFDDHSGIIELDQSLEPGSKFSDAYDLNDYLLDIENKSLTHRPDTFGIIGFAREVSAIQDKKFSSPSWMKSTDEHYDTIDQAMLPSITIDNPELSAQYSAVVLSGADSNRKSPMEVQTLLSRIGMRPINAPVDVTNFMMMVSGQPMHTFDYDKLVSLSGGKPEVHVRLGRPGEKLLLLDDKEIEVTTDDIVISAGDTAIGLAGGMGCKNTAIDENTKNILLEVATFNLYNMRGTQMRHGIFSEAITRFTKGQPSGLCLPALYEAVRLLGEWSGAKPVSDVVVAYGKSDKNEPVKLNLDYVNKILGTKLDIQRVVKILENAEFEVKTNDSQIEVLAPFWRTDIHIAEDVVEEVGRLNGYDEIEPTIPRRLAEAVEPSAFDSFRSKVKRLLARSGANEVYTYSFVHGNDLDKNGLTKENSYKIVNAISPELQYYRQSLTPGLLGLVHPNLKSGFSDFSIFEMNKVHQKSFGLNEENVPKEADMLALVVTHKANSLGATYYEAKNILNFVLDFLAVEATYISLEQSDKKTIHQPYEPKRSAEVYCGNEPIGVVGEFKTSVRNANKLDKSVAGFEIDLDKLFKAYQQVKANYEPASKYPLTERDICFRAEDHQTYGAIEFALKQSKFIDGVMISFEPLDIYRAKGSDKKNITIKIQIQPMNKTLTGDEANNIINDIASQVCAICNATVI